MSDIVQLLTDPTFAAKVAKLAAAHAATRPDSERIRGPRARALFADNCSRTTWWRGRKADPTFPKPDARDYYSVAELRAYFASLKARG